MRIGLIAPPALRVPPVRYGGTELVVKELCDGLAARGHEVVLYASGDSRVACELRGRFGEARWPAEPLDEWEHVAHAVADLAAEGRVDVVHAHTPAAVALAPFLPAPFVYTIHHGPSARLSELYAAHPEVAYVAISRRQRQLEWRLAEAEVVLHGLGVDRYPEGRPEPEAPYLLFLGRLSSCKGPEVAIDVAGRLGLPLRVAGRAHPEGSEEAERFRTEIEPRLASPWVARLGYVDHEDKVRLLGGATALLCPTRWEEPFGLAAVEAMLCGCPVVAFPRGALPELIDPGVTGFCVRDAAEMEAVLRRSVPAFDRRACRERARARFGAAAMVESYLAVYHRALRRRRREPAVLRAGDGVRG